METNSKKVLVTGSAGFIGMHAVLELVSKGYEVIGLDNLNTYYDVDLKLSRLQKQGVETSQIQYNKLLPGGENIKFIQLDISDKNNLEKLFRENQFDYVLHLAAQAGVRYSLENPDAYVDSNVKGFLNILECAKNFSIKHLVFASSSSVYGTNKEVPFSEDHRTDNQVSLYAATKKANESMAHSYAAVYKLKITGLRFFTVYGPYGRPDMALFKFTKQILKDNPIDVYNNGELSRDFTYIDDIVNGVVNLIEKPSNTEIPYDIYNIGRGEPVLLMDFIKYVESALGKKAKLNFLPMQKGDVHTTYSSTDKLSAKINYSSKTSIEKGITEFVNWYKGHYGY